MSQYSYIGKGDVWIAAPGQPLRNMGNVLSLSISADEESKELADYQNAGGGTIDSITRIKSVKVEIESSNISPENLAIALRGVVNAHTAGPIVDEALVADLGGLNLLARLPDLTAAMIVKNSAGSTTYVENTDYTRTRSGIQILSSGSIADAEALKVSYAALADNVLEAMVASAQEYRLVFEGLNEARSGKPVVVEAYKVKFSPSGTDLIGDDFGKIKLSASLNKDESRIGAGISQYFKTRIAQL